MRATKLGCGLRVGAAVVWAAFPLWLRADEPQKVERELKIVVQSAADAAPAPTAARVFKLAVAEDQAASDHWIGVQLEPLSDTLKSQLVLDHGLVVVQVFPDSPAAKAELKEHDILLRAGETAITEAGEILKIVGVSKDKELIITALRGGKELAIKITPAKRPVEIHIAGRAEPQASQDWERHSGDVSRQIHEALQALQKAHGDEKQTLGMYFIHPGIVGDAKGALAARLHGQLRLWDNVSININKDGDKPAKITVTRDGKNYEVTDDKIDDLPEDLRGPVKQMLNKQEFRLRVVTPGTAAGPAATLNLTQSQPLTASQPKVIYNAVPNQQHVQALRVDASGKVEQKLDAILQKIDQLSNQKLEDLQREVKQLRAELDELRKKRGAK